MNGGIRVVVCGACGRMGQETAKAVASADDMELVGVCDTSFASKNYAEVAGVTVGDLRIRDDLGALIDDVRPDAVVEFTSPASVMGNIRVVLAKGVPAVVGTTGINSENLKEIEDLAGRNSAPAIVVPNFAIGAVLMMKFAGQAAQYLPNVEIIELHHDKKLDSPSGTALKTCEMIAAGKVEGTGEMGQAAGGPGREFEYQGVRVHSVRLPGLVAHQEVIFGGQGQTLSIRHDSIDRTSFMPGVLLAIRKAQHVQGLVYGLEKIL